MRLPVYLDYLASTPVDPRVAQAMQECLTLDGVFANPASRSHGYGWQAEAAVEQGRSELASLLGADPRDIILTSGATEADNLALLGRLGPWARDRGHLVTTSIEHKAILDCAQVLQEHGTSVTYVPPQPDGLVDPQRIADAMRPDTRLVSVMWVNNELGTVNDLETISALCRARGVLLHVDAAQAVGKLPVRVDQLPMDMLSVSAHKFYGPKGVGALWASPLARRALSPILFGGGHERGLRSGTLPTHQIAGMGCAAAIAEREMAEEATRLRALRDCLWQHLQALGDVYLNGHPEQRVSGALNVAVGGVEGESLLLALSDLATSTGSACTSASLAPSYVLKAIGVSDQLAHASLRLSLGRFTTAEEVDYVAQHLSQVIQQLRR